MAEVKDGEGTEGGGEVVEVTDTTVGEVQEARVEVVQKDPVSGDDEDQGGGDEEDPGINNATNISKMRKPDQ